ncbi:MAG: DEAD/DEAH box helicase family protein [Gammaproteobacteria bacterium]|nr:DEAD/DEAH box helicase family protein [Gammaproteobacteria bacterium]
MQDNTGELNPSSSVNDKASSPPHQESPKPVAGTKHKNDESDEQESNKTPRLGPNSIPREKIEAPFLRKTTPVKKTLMPLNTSFQATTNKFLAQKRQQMIEQKTAQGLNNNNNNNSIIFNPPNSIPASIQTEINLSEIDVLKNAHLSLSRFLAEIERNQNTFEPKPGKKVEIRDYQLSRLKKFCESNPENPKLFDMPTGTGKTVVIATLVRGMLPPVAPKKSVRILIVVSRKALVKQTKDQLKEKAPHLKEKEVTAFSPTNESWKTANVVIITYQSLFKRVQMFFPEDKKQRRFDIMFGDELHNALSEKWVAKIDYILLRAPIVGFTATADYDNDQKSGKSSVYDLLHFSEERPNPIPKMTILEAIDCKAVVPVRTGILYIDTNSRENTTVSGGDVQERFVNKTVFNLAAVKTYCTEVDPKNRMPLFGKNIMVFSAGIKHSNKLADLFNQYIKLKEHPTLRAVRATFLKNMRKAHALRQVKYDTHKSKKTKINLKREFYNIEFDEMLDLLETRDYDAKYENLYNQYRYEVACSINSKSPSAKLAIKKFKAGGILVAVGTKMLTEGLDAKVVARLNWSYTGSLVNAQQQLGRFVRLSIENDVVMPKIGYNIDAKLSNIRGQVLAPQCLNGNYSYGSFEELDNIFSRELDHSLELRASVERLSQIDAFSTVNYGPVSWEPPSNNTLTTTIVPTYSSSNINPQTLRHARNKHIDTLSKQLENSMLGLDNKMKATMSFILNNNVTFSEKTISTTQKQNTRRKTVRPTVTQPESHISSSRDQDENWMDQEQLSVLQRLVRHSNKLMAYFDEIFDELLMENSDSDEDYEEDIAGIEGEEENRAEDEAANDTRRNRPEKRAVPRLSAQNASLKRIIGNIRRLKKNLKELAGDSHNAPQTSHSDDNNNDDISVNANFEFISERYEKALELCGDMQMLFKDEQLAVAINLRRMRNQNNTSNLRETSTDENNNNSNPKDTNTDLNNNNNSNTLQIPPEAVSMQSPSTFHIPNNIGPLIAKLCAVATNIYYGETAITLVFRDDVAKIEAIKVTVPNTNFMWARNHIFFEKSFFTGWLQSLGIEEEVTIRIQPLSNYAYTHKTNFLQIFRQACVNVCLYKHNTLPDIYQGFSSITKFGKSYIFTFEPETANTNIAEWVEGEILPGKLKTALPYTTTYKILSDSPHFIVKENPKNSSQLKKLIKYMEPTALFLLLSESISVEEINNLKVDPTLKTLLIKLRMLDSDISPSVTNAQNSDLDIREMRTNENNNNRTHTQPPIAQANSTSNPTLFSALCAQATNIYSQEKIITLFFTDNIAVRMPATKVPGTNFMWAGNYVFISKELFTKGIANDTFKEKVIQRIQPFSEYKHKAHLPKAYLQAIVNFCLHERGVPADKYQGFSSITEFGKYFILTFETENANTNIAKWVEAGILPSKTKIATPGLTSVPTQDESPHFTIFKKSQPEHSEQLKTLISSLKPTPFFTLVPANISAQDINSLSVSQSLKALLIKLSTSDAKISPSASNDYIFPPGVKYETVSVAILAPNQKYLMLEANQFVNNETITFFGNKGVTCNKYYIIPLINLNSELNMDMPALKAAINRGQFPETNPSIIFDLICQFEKNDRSTSTVRTQFLAFRNTTNYRLSSSIMHNLHAAQNDNKELNFFEGLTRPQKFAFWAITVATEIGMRLDIATLFSSFPGLESCFEHNQHYILKFTPNLILQNWLTFPILSNGTFFQNYWIGEPTDDFRIFAKYAANNALCTKNSALHLEELFTIDQKLTAAGVNNQLKKYIQLQITAILNSNQVDSIINQSTYVQPQTSNSGSAPMQSANLVDNSNNNNNNVSQQIYKKALKAKHHISTGKVFYQGSNLEERVLNFLIEEIDKIYLGDKNVYFLLRQTLTKYIRKGATFLNFSADTFPLILCDGKYGIITRTFFDETVKPYMEAKKISKDIRQIIDYPPHKRNPMLMHHMQALTDFCLSKVQIAASTCMGLKETYEYGDYYILCFNDKEGAKNIQLWIKNGVFYGNNSSPELIDTRKKDSRTSLNYFIFKKQNFLISPIPPIIDIMDHIKNTISFKSLMQSDSRNLPSVVVQLLRELMPQRPDESRQPLAAPTLVSETNNDTDKTKVIEWFKKLPTQTNFFHGKNNQTHSANFSNNNNNHTPMDDDAIMRELDLI